MYDICENVALKHGGSLKAEHGTGRNVAPFVEMEWGTKAYKLMWEVRRHRQRALPPRVLHKVAQAPRAQPRCPCLSGQAAVRPAVSPQPGRGSE